MPESRWLYQSQIVITYENHLSITFTKKASSDTQADEGSRDAKDTNWEFRLHGSQCLTDIKATHVNTTSWRGRRIYRTVQCDCSYISAHTHTPLSFPSPSTSRLCTSNSIQTQSMPRSCPQHVICSPSFLARTKRSEQSRTAIRRHTVQHVKSQELSTATFLVAWYLRVLLDIFQSPPLGRPNGNKKKVTKKFDSKVCYDAISIFRNSHSRCDKVQRDTIEGPRSAYSKRHPTVFTFIFQCVVVFLTLWLPFFTSMHCLLIYILASWIFLLQWRSSWSPHFVGCPKLLIMAESFTPAPCLQFLRTTATHNREPDQIESQPCCRRHQFQGGGLGFWGGRGGVVTLLPAQTPNSFEVWGGSHPLPNPEQVWGFGR